MAGAGGSIFVSRGGSILISVEDGGTTEKRLNSDSTFLWQDQDRTVHFGAKMSGDEGQVLKSHIFVSQLPERSSVHSDFSSTYHRSMENGLRN